MSVRRGAADVGARPAPAPGVRQVPSEPRPHDVRDLWRRLRENNDALAREKLVLNYSPLLKCGACRVAPTLSPHVEERDPN